MVIGDKQTQIPGGAHYRPTRSCGRVMKATHGLLNILVAILTKKKKKERHETKFSNILYVYSIYVYNLTNVSQIMGFPGGLSWLRICLPMQQKLI